MTHSVIYRSNKGGEDELLIGEHVPTGGRDDNIMVEVVTADEEPIAVPIAESVPASTDPKLQNGNARPHPTTGTTVQDSGFDCLLCGDVKVKRLRPGSNVFLSLCGDVYMDIKEGDYPPGSNFHVFILRLCGNVRMIVPCGTQVRAWRLLCT
jgi:hypothetical protein